MWRLMFLATILSAWQGATCCLAFNGTSLPIRSTGGPAGTDWVMYRNGYVGTYIKLDAPGQFDVDVIASGSSSDGVLPHMNIVVADTKAGFDVTPGFDEYHHTFDLPAGTYFVRTEFSNDVELTGRNLIVRDLSFFFAPNMGSSQNQNTITNALAAADTYIQNFRKGNVTVEVPGVAADTPVEVSLKRHAFNFGTAVPGSDAAEVANYLGSGGTDQQVNYQAMLQENFNAVVPEHAGRWANNESERDVVSMEGVDAILEYAESNHMRARMKSLIMGDDANNGHQPSWVLNSGLLDQAFNEDPMIALAAQDELREEITERIDYYVGIGMSEDRAHKYVELDVYNQSYHTGQGADAEEFPHNYWNAYGAIGVAGIYDEIAQRIAASNAPTKLFVNETRALTDDDFANFFVENIEHIRRAGLEAEYDETVGGIGVEYIPDELDQDHFHVVQRAMQNLQNLSVQGLPITFTAFGVDGLDPGPDADEQAILLAQTQAAKILDQTMPIAFGTADTTGFFLNGFVAEDGGDNLDTPISALYSVDTSDWTEWNVTEPGKIWRDRLGIEDFDGDSTNGWTTQLTAMVDAEGDINFDGFWGDYEITVDGQTFELTLVKGQTEYSLVSGPALPGDYNLDGVVDAADYTAWRDTLGQAVTDSYDGADGNGDKEINAADYEVWVANFGRTSATGSAAATAVPEPATATSALLCIIALTIGHRNDRRASAQQARLRIARA